MRITQTGNETCSIPREANTANYTHCIQCLAELACGGIPDPNGVVIGARGQLLTIRREGH